jgi:hypothetical protein
VRQIKSYLCATGAEQHSHKTVTAVDYGGNRDSIWKSPTGVGWPSYKASVMTDIALVATEATKDLWAAFIRVMALPQAERERAATAEAQRLADAWLGFDEGEVRGWYAQAQHRDDTYVLGNGEQGKGHPAKTCLEGLKIKSGQVMDKVRELETAQKACLFHIEPSDQKRFPDRDPNLHIPYYWKWKFKTWHPVPATYSIPRD